MARRRLHFIIYLLGAILAAVVSRRLDKAFLKRHSASYVKPASQNPQNDSSQRYSANQAVDGNSATCSRTNKGKNPWWKVDLGTKINVSTIEVQNSWKHPLVIHVYVMKDIVEGGHNCGVKHILEGGETRLISCVPSIFGRFVKIVIFGEDESLSLCEVQVFDDTAPLIEGVVYEAWFNVTNGTNGPLINSLPPLYNFPKFISNEPDSKGVVATFQAPRNITDHYGVRMITYYIPPERGNYTFYMSGDNSCRLFIREINWTAARQIGIIPPNDDLPPWTLFDHWNGSMAESIYLLNNHVYKLTALMKEGTGKDHLRVGVLLPSGHRELPISNKIFTSEDAAKTVIRIMEKRQGSSDGNKTSEEKTKTDSVMEAAVSRYESIVSNIKIIDDIEKLAFAEARLLPLYDKAFASLVSRKNDFVVAAIAISLDKYRGFKFPGNVENSRFFKDGSITFPDTMFGAKKGRASMVCMMFKPLEVMKENTADDYFIGTNIICASVQPRIENYLSKPVELVFRHTTNVTKTEPCCVFWNENNYDESQNHSKFGRWSDEGCEAVYTNDTHTICECNHLTKFAVLFPVLEGSRQDELNLELITYIGLSLSAAGCFITFAVYLILRITRTLKAMIHLNLVFALGLADLAFLFGNLAVNNKDACFGSTVLTFYLYLAVFGWMLVEGVHLYFLVIRVFGSDDHRRKRYYFFTGWGIPLIIVIITCVVLRFDVVSKHHCWLSAENGAIWVFIAPALLVIFINGFILAAVLRTTMTVLRRDPGHSKEKSALRTLAMLLPILGITWVFGVVMFANDSIVFQYIFAVCNAFQGFFIFILYCLLNTEVRNEYKRKVKAWRTEREIDSKKSRQQSFDLVANSSH